MEMEHLTACERFSFSPSVISFPCPLVVGTKDVSPRKEESEEEAFLFHHESIRSPEVWAMSDAIALTSEGQLYKTPV